MANITILRVSSKKNIKKPVLLFLFWLGFSLAVVLIYMKFFLDSIMYLESQSVKIVRTTNLKTLQRVIFYSIPVFNTTSGISRQTDNNLFMGVLDCKKILQEKYPILTFYNSVPSRNIIAEVEPSAEIDRNRVTAGTEETENKTSKIYSKTVLIKSMGVAIRNNTNYKVNINKLITEPLKFKITKKSVDMIIFHTHTTEAYMPEKKDKINTDITYRTTSPSGNVTRVGLELEKQLKALNLSAFHDTTIHDYPEYLGAYSRSLKTTLKDLKKYPQAKMVIDIHRDANSETEGSLRIATKINGADAAKIMFVVGTDELGLKHKDWRENLKLAVKLQEKANKIYPGLCREIDLRKERFNQHAAPGALIVEVGGTGNSILEAERSMKYLARIIAETLKTQ